MSSDKPPLLDVINAALKLSDQDLRAVLEYLGQEYKLRVKRADPMAAIALREGDWVEMVKDGRKLPAGAKGHVVEIRRGKVDVHFPDHGMWTVSATMVHKVDRPPSAEVK
ncbi:MAG: hypothetical protein HYY16_12605 [Planctomycetes bacterium]|nr:hypothetical protein [Planctomycetota bacterium]